MSDANHQVINDSDTNSSVYMLTDAQQRMILAGVTDSEFKKAEAARPAPPGSATDGYDAAVLEGWWKMNDADSQTRPARGLEVPRQRHKSK